MGKTVKKLKVAKTQEDEPEEEPPKKVEKPVVQKVITEEDKKRSQVLLSAFTDCMSALSSNKISTRNAFDVGLIDTLDEVVHMSGDSDDDEIRDIDEDDEIPDSSKKQGSKLSFTRASKAIEGASRLYGYRVEAIYDQTFNVLASMNAAANPDDPAEGGQQKEKTKKKKANFSDANRTLLSEKDSTMDVIPVNEGILDPYFLKVSSLFDQAGAVGLLLANMHIDTELTLGFVGSNPIFPQYNESMAGETGFHLTNDQIKGILFDNPADLEKSHVLPQINAYRNELKRLTSSGTEEKQQVPTLSLSTSMSGISDQKSTTSESAQPQPEPQPESEAQPELDMPPPDEPMLDMDMDIPQLPADLSAWESPGHMDMQMDPFEGDKQETDNYHVRTIKLNLTALDGMDNSDNFDFRRKRIKSILGELSVTKQKTESKRAQENEMDFQEALLEFVTGENNEHEIDPSVAKGMGLSTNLFESDEFDSSKVESKLNDLFAKVKIKIPPMDPNIALDGTSLNAPFKDTYLTCLSATLNRKLKLMVSKDECYLTVANADDVDTPFSTFEEVTTAELTHRAIVESDNEEGDYDENLDTHVLEELPEMPEEDENLQNDTEQDKEKADLATLGLNRNIDIAMIKQALSSIILPTSDFLDAVENENQQVEEVQAPKVPEKVKEFTFRSAVKETLHKLGTRDPSKGVNVHILFVCLLHVCNDHDVLLRQEEEAKAIQIVIAAPENQHLS